MEIKGACAGGVVDDNHHPLKVTVNSPRILTNDNTRRSHLSVCRIDATVSAPQVLVLPKSPGLARNGPLGNGRHNSAAIVALETGGHQSRALPNGETVTRRGPDAIVCSCCRDDFVDRSHACGSASSSRYPTPASVVRYRGRVGLASILRRSVLM